MPGAALNVLRQALGTAMVCINVLEPDRNGQCPTAGVSPDKCCGMDTQGASPNVGIGGW